MFSVVVFRRREINDAIVRDFPVPGGPCQRKMPGGPSKNMRIACRGSAWPSAGKFPEQTAFRIKCNHGDVNEPTFNMASMRDSANFMSIPVKCGSLRLFRISKT